MAGRSGRAGPDPRWLLVVAAIAIHGTLLAHAGYSDRGQIAFVVLAAGALLALWVLDPESLRGGVREPVVVAIALLALLSAASAAWTIGEAGDALRWGAVVAGYAAIALTGVAVGRRGGAPVAALLLVVLAVGTGLIGMFAAGVQAEPFAERIGGAWRPGGPFEYPPALGALQLAAIPLALTWMTTGGRRAAAGAIVAAVASAVIALVSSRAILALAVLLLVVIAARPQGTIGVARPLAVAAVCFALTAAAAADAVAGSYADPYATTSDLPRVVGLALLLPAGAALWLALRSCFDQAGNVLRGAARRALVLSLIPLLAAASAAALTRDRGDAVEPDSGLTHGRVEIWGDAAETALDGEFLGSGALTFLEASRPEQQPPAARFAHNLVLEEWVELGYPGLALGLALIAAAIALVVRARGTEAGWLLGVGAIAYLVALLVDWPWHVPASAAIFAFILGALAGTTRLRQPPWRRVPLVIRE